MAKVILKEDPKMCTVLYHGSGTEKTVMQICKSVKNQDTGIGKGSVWVQIVS